MRGVRVLRRLVLGSLAGAVISLLPTTNVSALEVGQRAPDFTLVSQDGKSLRLTDLLAKGPVVIFTFIEAFTRG